MASFVYRGISAKQQADLLAKYMANVKPQDPRAKPPMYHIDQRDSEEKKEAKRARKAKYMADRETEYKKELAALAEKQELVDSQGRKFVFERGKPVEVPESSSLHARLAASVKNADRVPYPYWEYATEKNTKKHTDEQPKA